MILNVFAVKDLKAKAFLQPFFSNSRGSAMRAFGDAVQDKNCPFNKHPEDYILYEIGTYDDSSAYLTMVPLDLVVQASDFVVDQPKNLPENVIYDKTINMGLEEAISNGKKSS